jgi:uncharacterized protein
MSADTVQLKEYHLFSYDGEYYLFIIDDMTSFIIDEEQYGILKEIKTRPFDSAKYGNLNIYLSLLNLIKSANKNRKRELPASFPVSHIMLNVTQECNLNCKYCFAVGGEYGSRGNMSRETAFKSVDWLIENSGAQKDLIITFFGGEPLLNFALIKETVLYVRAKKTEKEVSFAIICNGTLLNAEIIEFFKIHDFRVGIGFDALERLQNYYRPFKDGRASYDLVRKNISDLVDSGITRINITCMVSDEKSDFREARQALINTGCAVMGIQRPAPPILKSDEADTMEIFATIRSGEVKEYTEKLLLSVEEEGRDWLASIKERKAFPSKLYSGITGLLRAGRKRDYYCGAGKAMVNISISGDIYACHRFNGLEHMKMGTIENFNAQSQTRYIENHTSRISECSLCQARYFCGAGCIHENLSVEGSIGKPYGVWCEMMKRAMEAGIAVYHQLDDQDKAYLKSTALGSGLTFA